MIFGIFCGTYSSIFVAATLLIHFKLKRGGDRPEKDGAEKDGAVASVTPG